MYHIFFILSSVSGCLGCFHVLAIVNSTAVNIGVHVFCWIIVLFQCMPGASLVAQRLKCLPAMLKTWVWPLGREDPLEKEMATHSSIRAWRIPWTEEPGRLQSTGLQRVGHDWATLLHFMPRSGIAGSYGSSIVSF